MFLVPHLRTPLQVKEIAQTMTRQGDLRFQGTALLALQEAAEAFLVDWFSKCNELAVGGCELHRVLVT